MPAKQTALLAFGATVLFWCSLFGFAALSPRYSHFTKSVSELGAWGAPNMWAFNILGFIGPGLLLALFGLNLARYASPRTWLTAALLVLAGFCLALAGLSPADMSNFTSPTTIGHLVGSNGNALFWMLAIIALAIATRKSWAELSIGSVLAFALMVAAFSLYFWSDIPRAIIQRIGLAILFGWYAVAAVLLIARDKKSNSGAG